MRAIGPHRRAVLAGVGAALIASASIVRATGRPSVFVAPLQPGSPYADLLGLLGRAVAAERGADIVIVPRAKAWRDVPAGHAVVTDDWPTVDGTFVSAGIVEIAPMVLVARSNFEGTGTAAEKLGLMVPRANIRRPVVVAGTPAERRGALALLDASGNDFAVDVPATTARQELIARDQDLAVLVAADAVEDIRAGGAMADLAVASEAPLTALWDTPAAPDAGLPLFLASSWSGLYVPDAAIAADWNQALQAALARSALIEALDHLGHGPAPDTHRSAAAHGALLLSAREADMEVRRRLGL